MANKGKKEKDEKRSRGSQGIGKSPGEPSAGRLAAPLLSQGSRMCSANPGNSLVIAEQTGGCLRERVNGFQRRGLPSST